MQNISVFFTSVQVFPETFSPKCGLARDAKSHIHTVVGEMIVELEPCTSFRAWSCLVPIKNPSAAQVSYGSTSVCTYEMHPSPIHS